MKTFASIELAEREAIQRLNALPEQMAWSQEGFLWIWTSDQPRLVVLLTDTGKSMSQEMVTGIEAEKIRAFMSIRAKDLRWYRGYKNLSENP